MPLIATGNLSRTHFPTLASVPFLLFDLSRGSDWLNQVTFADEVFWFDGPAFAQHFRRQLHERFLRGRLLRFLFFFPSPLLEGRQFGNPNHSRSTRHWTGASGFGGGIGPRLAQIAHPCGPDRRRYAADRFRCTAAGFRRTGRRRFRGLWR